MHIYATGDGFHRSKCIEFTSDVTYISSGSKPKEHKNNAKIFGSQVDFIASLCSELPASSLQ